MNSSGMKEVLLSLFRQRQNNKKTIVLTTVVNASSAVQWESAA